MKTRFVLIAFVIASASAYAGGTGKNSAEYKEAYKCGYEGLLAGSGGAAYCVGNSRDPSRLEMSAYADAERDFKARSKAPGCSFGYGLWVAGGSRADDFLEGPQKATTLKAVANLLPGREFKFFDKNGRPVPVEIAQRWFIRKGHSFSVSPEARKTCSKGQLG